MAGCPCQNQTGEMWPWISWFSTIWSIFPQDFFPTIFPVMVDVFGWSGYIGMVTITRDFAHVGASECFFSPSNKLLRRHRRTYNIWWSVAVLSPITVSAIYIPPSIQGRYWHSIDTRQRLSSGGNDPQSTVEVFIIWAIAATSYSREGKKEEQSSSSSPESYRLVLNFCSMPNIMYTIGTGN